MNHDALMAEIERSYEALLDAAQTFSDLRVALELLRHETLAMACAIAEEHIRSMIEELTVCALPADSSAATRLARARAIHKPGEKLIGDRVCLNCGRPLFEHTEGAVALCPRKASTEEAM